MDLIKKGQQLRGLSRSDFIPVYGLVKLVDDFVGYTKEYSKKTKAQSMTQEEIIDDTAQRYANAVMGDAVVLKSVILILYNHMAFNLAQGAYNGLELLINQ